jgi:hypothetical protein
MSLSRSIFWGIVAEKIGIEAELKCGRVFRYNFDATTLRPGLRWVDIDAIANRVVAEKYRETSWERSNPDISPLSEIVSSVRLRIIEYLLCAYPGMADLAALLQREANAGNAAWTERIVADLNIDLTSASAIPPGASR